MMATKTTTDAQLILPIARAPGKKEKSHDPQLDIQVMGQDLTGD